MDSLLLGQYMESSGIGAVTMGSGGGPSIDPKKDSGSVVLTKDQRIEKVENFRTTKSILLALPTACS